MSKKELLNMYSGLMIFSFFILLCIVQPVKATENPVETDTEMSGKASVEWEYEFEDRADPFMPFIQTKVATINIPEEEVVLTGMQIFEPGQLKLVGIMFSPTTKLAMVEDVTGKGYVLNEGMLIGRYGVVDEINMNQVNIIETREVADRNLVTPVAMRLNKEGE